MLAGLVNSPLVYDTAPTRETVQNPLFPEDTVHLIAELREQLRRSEAAYDGLVDAVAELELECKCLRAEVRCWKEHSEAAHHVLVYGQRGIVRGRT